MKIITTEIKDLILEYIFENRNGAFFEITDSKSEELFGLDESLMFSFLKELEQLKYIRSLQGTGSGAAAFTLSSLDSFYSQGGFAKHYSIKNLLEDRLLVEVEQILKGSEAKDKKDILAKVKELIPILTSGINLIDKATGLIQ